MQMPQRAGLWLVLACLVMVRLFAAPGLMPGRDANGTITLSICSETGLAPSMIAIPIDRDSDSGNHEDEQHCPFALTVHHAALPDAGLLIPEPAAAIPAQPSQFVRLSLGTYAPLPPSTGPPSLTA